jgi:hypothetical protein
MTTTSDIIAELANRNHSELVQIREAVDARVAELRTAFMAQAAEMGLACSDENGKPKRKRRANVDKQAE